MKRLTRILLLCTLFAALVSVYLAGEFFRRTKDEGRMLFFLLVAIPYLVPFTSMRNKANLGTWFGTAIVMVPPLVWLTYILSFGMNDVDFQYRSPLVIANLIFFLGGSALLVSAHFEAISKVSLWRQRPRSYSYGCIPRMCILIE